MKNKALTYILLVVVGLIWYQVFYRVSENLFGEDTAVPDPMNTMSANFVIERDTFDLLANYRDPFVEDKKPVVLTGMEEPPPARVLTTSKPPKPKTQWPPITYFGIVKKTQSKEPLAILKVDGLQLMLRKGEEMFNDIVLKEVWRDSIQVAYKKEKKTFYR